MDITLIVMAALVLAASAVAVFTLSALRDWIDSRIGSFRNRQIVAGALRERLQTKGYKVYPFIYDEQEDSVLDVDHVQAKALDEKLEEKFAGQNELILPIQQ